MIKSSYLARELPPELGELAALAKDLRWTWSHESDALWRLIDPDIWERTENPYVVLQNLTETRLQELVADKLFRDHLSQLAVKRRKYLSQPGWFQENYGPDRMGGIAYFSMEFGLGEALPMYAGGLGILAGDYLKAASDLGLPVNAIGLLYQEGYFRQGLGDDGWQLEAYPYNDPAVLPVFPVEDPSGAWLTVEVQFPGRVVRCRAWQAHIGGVSLYLLDSNDPLNSPVDRGITAKLYGGGEEMRLAQEIVLGIGGWRLIAALGLSPEVCHLNEGHAAFATLERAHHIMQQDEVGFREAVWRTRPGNLFTTHTAVPAGFDVYPGQLLKRYGPTYAKQLGIPLQELASLGRLNPDDENEPFNMAFLAARTCGAINAVSRLHGNVSRDIFQGLFPRWPRAEVPVCHITNGVHVPTWDSPWADEVWTSALGKERWRGCPDPVTSPIENLRDEELWLFAAQERGDLVRYVRGRLASQCSQRGDDPETIAKASRVLEPHALTLGFARRFAAYKRPNLLLHDTERLIRLLNHPDRPVQVIVAGKAHPRDDVGKGFVQEWAQFVRRPEVRQRVVFLEDYDMALAQEMVQGVDVWINTPRRPWEACGTSGMKVLVNGGLNLSVLDGWWDEAYSPDVGWALGDHRDRGPEYDGILAEELYALLENEVVPLFYDRDAVGIPRAWVAKIRASLTRLAPRFNATRMVRDYVDELYLTASEDYHERNEYGAKLGTELTGWETSLRRHWHEVRWGQRSVRAEAHGLVVEVEVCLGRLTPDGIQVQLYADGVDGSEVVSIPMTQTQDPGADVHCFRYAATIGRERPPGDYTARIVPFHPRARVPIELNLIHWAS